MPMHVNTAMGLPGERGYIGPEATLINAIDHYLKLTRPHPHGRITNACLDARQAIVELRDIKQGVDEGDNQDGHS